VYRLHCSSLEEAARRRRCTTSKLPRRNTCLSFRVIRSSVVTKLAIKADIAVWSRSYYFGRDVEQLTLCALHFGETQEFPQMCAVREGSGECVADRGIIDGYSHWHSGDFARGARVLLLGWFFRLLISVIDTTGSSFSTSTSISFMDALRPPASRSLAACLRRRRAGKSHNHAVIVIRARRAPTPATEMTARTEVDMPPTDVVMVVVI
jgi:hypothetical protein